MEVWVPFDRLWRSSNRIGPVDGAGVLGDQDGRLWEISETGQDGEPLGTESGIFKGEGKHVPAHLRQSHRMFVEEVKCAQCNDAILERCESCSVRMHCMGCRKTLCASCAFNRPIPRKRVKTRHFANLAFGPAQTLGTPLAQASGSSASLQDQNRNAASQKTASTSTEPMSEAPPRAGDAARRWAASFVHGKWGPETCSSVLSVGGDLAPSRSGTVARTR